MWVASGKDDVGLVGDRGLQQASKKQTKKNPTHTRKVQKQFKTLY